MADPREAAAIIIDRTIERLRALPLYSGRPSWDQIVAEEMETAILAAEERARKLALDELWDALKKRCCADPAKATRCVMVGRDDLARAMRALKDDRHE